MYTNQHSSTWHPSHMLHYSSNNDFSHIRHSIDHSSVLNRNPVAHTNWETELQLSQNKRNSIQHTLWHECKQYSRKLFSSALPFGCVSQVYFWHKSSSELQTSPIDFSTNVPFTSTRHVVLSAIENGKSLCDNSNTELIVWIRLMLNA